MSPFEVDKQIKNFVTKQTHSIKVQNAEKKEISKIQIYGVNQKAELNTLIETLKFTYSGLKFKNELSEDVNMQDYLRERATIEKNGKEICVTFNFADNPIVSTDFNIGYNVESNLSYEDYYDGEYYSGPKNRIYEPPSGMSGGGYSHFHRGVNTSIYGYDNGSSHGNHNGNENNY